MKRWIGYCPEFLAGSNFQRRCYGDVFRIDLVMCRCVECGAFHSVTDMPPIRSESSSKAAASLTPHLRLVR